MTHLKDVVSQANLVWHAQLTMEPEARPVEYDMTEEEQLRMQEKELSCQ